MLLALPLQALQLFLVTLRRQLSLPFLLEARLLRLPVARVRLGAGGLVGPVRGDAARRVVIDAELGGQQVEIRIETRTASLAPAANLAFESGEVVIERPARAGGAGRVSASMRPLPRSLLARDARRRAPGGGGSGSGGAATVTCSPISVPVEG
jgi:hypothetical protein